MRLCVDGHPAPRARRGSRAPALRAALAGLLLALSAAAPAYADTPVVAFQAQGTVVESAAAREPGVVPALDEREAVRVGEAAVGSEVPDIVLLDRRGRPLRLSAYRGKPLLVSFVYTGCFQVCPTQTRALYQAVRGLDRMLGPRQFNVVSIGFNQPFDSPDAMRAFAAQNRIDDPNWEFLSPPREAVEPLTRAFGFSYVATPAGFDHVLGVTVVDAEGRIAAQVWGDKLRADRLGVPLRRLLLAAPPPAESALTTMVERERILSTVYDPDTGEYRYDFKLILQIIGGSLFFVTALVYLLLEWRAQRRARSISCAANPPASGKPA
jgi:protein SCO1/2